MATVVVLFSPRSGLSLFKKGTKLAPRYKGPFEIVERIGIVAYSLALPTFLEHAYDVFYGSMLWKC